jgi:hypothetical protein
LHWGELLEKLFENIKAARAAMSIKKQEWFNLKCVKNMKLLLFFSIHYVMDNE